MSIHDGHRARLKRRFLEHGEQVFDDHQLLELMLFYAVPQGDVNPLAHRLMNHFGSFDAVLDAKPEELMRVKGVGDHTALYLSMFPQVLRRYMTSRSGGEERVCSAADAGEYLQPYFFGARNETAFLLCLDAKGKVLSCRFLAEGSLDRVGLNSRQVVETALAQNATTAILAHNHISGLALPSQADLTTTRRLRAVLREGGVELSDHLIFADDDMVSLRDSGLFEGYGAEVPDF